MYSHMPRLEHLGSSVSAVAENGMFFVPIDVNRSASSLVFFQSLLWHSRNMNNRNSLFTSECAPGSSGFFDRSTIIFCTRRMCASLAWTYR